MKHKESIDNVRICVDEVLSYVEHADYAGYDPYDALNSPLLSWLGARSKWLRIAFTQFFRRSPLNLRPLFCIPAGHNPKGIGLFLWGYARLYAIEKNVVYLERIHYLLKLLDVLRSPGYSGNCWGYNFDWQSRTVLRPKGTPTIVNTAFIGHALLDCYELTNIQKALDLAISIKDFVLKDLHRTWLGKVFCFSYTPLDRETVHNANLLGASILARLRNYCQDDRLVQSVQASMGYSMLHQRADGSWFYADTSIQKWIDSFHTGFNLQAIRYVLDTGLSQEYWPAYQNGMEYYAKQFFLHDGTPKYYHNRLYPIDIHVPAQAICYFCHEGSQYQSLTWKILQWMRESMYSNKGYFYFREGKIIMNRIPYMRWSQAWCFHALTEWLYSELKRSSHDDYRTTKRTDCPRRPHNLLPIT